MSSFGSPRVDPSLAMWCGYWGPALLGPLRLELRLALAWAGLWMSQAAVWNKEEPKCPPS